MSTSTPSTPRVYQIGTGTCRIDTTRAQTSACIVAGDTTLLIDIGYGVLDRLDAIAALERCRELHIHISHRHTDHLAGLFPLLQCLTWSDDYRHLSVERVAIHATQEVCELIERTRALWGKEETSLNNGSSRSANRRLEFHPGPDFEDWTYAVGEVQVRATHLPGHNNHGAACIVAGKRYAFSCDATEVNASLIRFCGDSDLCVFDFGHLTNLRQPDGTYTINLDPVIELLSQANPPVARAAHVYLRHLQHQHLSESERALEMARIVSEAAARAKERGFSGTLTLGKDGELLTRA